MQEAREPLSVGIVIHEHYIIESLLGKGDFGNIYLVRDLQDQQKFFALAELIKSSEEESFHFTLDYISLAPLDHQVLPDVQYVINDDKLDRAFLLMRYIEEPNLEILRLQQAEKRFSLAQVLTTLTPIINAIASLHSQQPPAIHGNIKPSNIIVPRTIDTPVLTLLNIFQEHNSTTMPLHYLTPGYGAIEQYKGISNERTDIYALGATCYTLLTGIIPPDAFSRVDCVSNGKTDPLRSVHEVIPYIPTAIAEVIQRAMSINADDRFSSVEQFHEVLVSAASQPSLRLSVDAPSSASPVSRSEQPAPLSSEELNGSEQAAFRQIAETPIPEPLLEQPHASYIKKTDPSESVVFIRAVETPTPAFMLEPARVLPKRRFILLFLILALLIGLSTGTGFWFHTKSMPLHSTTPLPLVIRSSATHIPTALPTLSVSLPLTGAYAGTIYDISANRSTPMYLTNIQRNQANISGYLTLASSIQGSGPFRGTIDITRHFQFVVIDNVGNAKLFFEGVMQSRTSLSGNYYTCNPIKPQQENRCSQTSGSYGIWNVLLT